MITKYLHVRRQISSLFQGYRYMSNLRIYPIIVLIVYSSYSAFAQAGTKDILRSKELESPRRVITDFFKKQAKVHYISHVVLNPEAAAVAWSVEEPQGSQAIYRAFLSHPDSVVCVSANSASGKSASETDPQWSPDGREIAFLSDAASPGQLQVFIADANAVRSVKIKPLTRFDGYVSHLKWSPNGKYLSVLYVEKASREPSPMAAENKTVGLIDSILNRNVQCIAVINRLTRKTVQVSPVDFYIFEYDWSPDNKKFVYTAAMPPGDDNWYIAQLYQQSIYTPDTVLLYKPLRQIALPRWSPDGKRIAFIEGLMSDQGGTGGEIFVISSAGNKPQNLTPKRPSTPSWFTWRSDSSMLFTEFTGGSVAFNTLNTATGFAQNVWKAGESIRAGSEEMSLSVGGSKTKPALTFIRSSWNKLPEVYCGSPDKLTQITHLNTALQAGMPKAENVEWVNEGQHVQGWLLYPQNYNPSKRYPMLVCVHGGPAWIATPAWSAPDFNTTVYTQLGYFVFFS